MTTRIGLLLLTALLPSLQGCCEGWRRVNKEIDGPEEQEAGRLIRERMKQDGGIADRLCGVSAQGLRDATFKRLSGGRYAVTGAPAAGAPARPATTRPGGAAGKPPIDPGQGLVCAGVLAISWKFVEGPGGTTWSIGRLEVDEVTTPGAEYKRRHRDHG